MHARVQSHDAKYIVQLCHITPPFSYLHPRTVNVTLYLGGSLWVRVGQPVVAGSAVVEVECPRVPLQ